jgi:hypothetical protein
VVNGTLDGDDQRVAEAVGVPVAEVIARIEHLAGLDLGSVALFLAGTVALCLAGLRRGRR